MNTNHLKNPDVLNRLAGAFLEIADKLDEVIQLPELRGFQVSMRQTNVNITNRDGRLCRELNNNFKPCCGPLHKGFTEMEPHACKTVGCAAGWLCWAFAPRRAQKDLLQVFFMSGQEALSEFVLARVPEFLRLCNPVLDEDCCLQDFVCAARHYWHIDTRPANEKLEQPDMRSNAVWADVSAWRLEPLLCSESERIDIDIVDSLPFAPSLMAEKFRMSAAALLDGAVREAQQSMLDEATNHRARDRKTREVCYA